MPTGKKILKKSAAAGKSKTPAKKATGKPAPSANPDFLNAGSNLKGAEQSQMFGKPCFKTGGKAFVCLFGTDMVFKLGGKEHEAAMKLKGAKLFDPSGSGRPMKEWVQVPPSNKSKWNYLAKEAMAYVKANSK